VPNKGVISAMFGDRSNEIKWWLALILFVAISLIFVFMSYSGKKTISTVEEVVLVSWGIKLHARIDTGAATSSLSVKNITVTNGMVRFTLPDKKSGKHVKLPLLEWRSIKSSDGIEESRPVVEMKIKLAGRYLRSQVTLDDRSKMSYPMLIGRRTLKGRFVVDVSRARTGTVEQVEGGRE